MTKSKPCTGAQLTMIQDLRKSIGLAILNTHEIRNLTIAIASTMISDLTAMRDTIKSLKDGASA